MFQILPALLLLLVQSQSHSGRECPRLGDFYGTRAQRRVEWNRFASAPDAIAVNAILAKWMAENNGAFDSSHPLYDIVAGLTPTIQPETPVRSEGQEPPGEISKIERSAAALFGTAQRLRDGPR